MENKKSVYANRKYGVLSTGDAKTVALRVLKDWGLTEAQTTFGLPEVDDRYHVWRVPVLSSGGQRVGEIVVDAKTSLVQIERTSAPEQVKERLRTAMVPASQAEARSKSSPIVRSSLRNTIIAGDAEETLTELPASSVDLVFTSPPYFNARPDYTEYLEYEQYLLKMRKVIQQAHRLLGEGRFFVINIAPVLLRRESRSKASKRVAVPFDLHRIFIEENFEFVDDIIWEKPSGAGWATGRGRRFAADRNPLQYKAVPVTEYVLVYRKKTDRLIDWNIRNHHDQDAVARSKIGDDYERTNIWKISPSSTKEHPAVFPLGLAERVVRYYSFEGDVVLDPFAGSGTTGQACVNLGRRFVLAELDETYVNVIRRKAVDWLDESADDVLCVNCDPIFGPRRLL